MGCLGFAALMAADAFTAPAAFWVVAVAMVLYGSFVAITLRLGPWRREAIGL
jgi:hypothetical protein